MLISNRIKTAAGLCLAVFALSGCLKDVDVPAFLIPDDAKTEDPDQTVLNGVTITAPVGYCVDETTLRKERTSGFVIFADCNAVNQIEVDTVAPNPVIYTVSVGERSDVAFSETLGLMDGYFATDAGAAALSRSGEAGDVRVLDKFPADDVYYLHVRDASDDVLTPAAETYWRAIFGIDRRTVSASVLGLRRHDVDSDTAQSALEALVAKILRENNADNG